MQQGLRNTLPAELLDLFLTYLSVEKGLSINTVNAYATDLKKYLLFMKEQGREAVKAGKPDILNFLELLRSDGYTDFYGMQIYILDQGLIQVSSPGKAHPGRPY